MATFQPAPNVVEIAVQGKLDNQLAENKFYVHSSATVTEAIVTDLVLAAAEWVITEWLPQLGSKFIYNRTVARDLTSEGSFEVVDTSNSGTAGSGGTDTSPNNVTWAAHRKTNRSGKYQKSRIYVPSIPNAARTTDNGISSASAIGFLTALLDFDTDIAALTGSTYTVGYVQRILDHVRLAVANFIPTTGWASTDLILDSMRRRLPGRGA